MWREMITVILLATLLPGQAQSQDDAAGFSRAPSPKIGVSPRYTELRRGTDEDVVVILMLPKDFVVSPVAEVPGIRPVLLELRPAEGLTITKLRYPRPHGKKFAFNPDPISVESATWFGIRLKVRADPATSLGVHTLAGRLTFQTVGDTGVSPPQEIPVQVVLTVVGRHAKVRKSPEYPFEKLSSGQIVEVIALSPVWVPIVMVCAIALGGCE
jgi:hypothetical protein